MVATASSSSSVSLKEYLKKYENNEEEEKKKKKKKKKGKANVTGMLVVDEDPVWQKPVKLEEENDDSDEEKPLVDEDIEVKRMKRLEELRARRPYGAISEDGSGWISVSDVPKSLNDQDFDMSPPRKQRVRNDTPSPEPEVKPSDGGLEITDSSPISQRRQHCRIARSGLETKPSYSSDQDLRYVSSTVQNSDISPPRKRRSRYDTPSPEPELRSLESKREGNDMSPPRRKPIRHHSPSLSPETKTSRIVGPDADVSPPRSHRSYKNFEGKNSTPDMPNISPPRRPHGSSSYQDISRASDLSPPRRSKKDTFESRGSSPGQSRRYPTEVDNSRVSMVSDLSPPRKHRKDASSAKERPKTGLVTGRDIKDEIVKTNRDAWLRFKDMDPSISGRGAEPVYRDKATGERISKDQMLKLNKKEEKPKEIKLEWGKGLAQKREAEAKQQELEIEKDKPFARTRDDPELDKMLKERLRWGDPMAHLVKKKHSEYDFQDLGDNEKMKESGFVIPQDIPSHSWIKRGLDAAPNRYGIRPGRHWDGVDRSNGFEKQMFKRTNEKQATEKEAYLWSVSDM